MLTDTAIITINIACIAVLVVLMAILAQATRMKGGAGWAAVILVTTTVPAYLANLTRDLGLDCVLAFFYVGISLNTLCFPATWFFTRRQLDKSFRLTAKSLLHTLPSFISLSAAILYYAPMSPAEVKADMAFMKAGGESLPAIINDILLFGQFFVYFAIIFFYCRKRLKYIRDNYSDSDYTEIQWTPRFLIAFFILFLICTAGYVINPRTDIWLLPILNSFLVIYLVYIVVAHSTASYLNRLPAEIPDAETAHTPSLQKTMTAEQMKEICDRVTKYLQNTQAYKNSDLTLSTIAHETGIYHKKISIAINAYLNKNFFELINTMRIQEAKRLLQSLNINHTIESIYKDCGFHSRSSFFMIFKKMEGVTPAQWLKHNK